VARLEGSRCIRACRTRRCCSWIGQSRGAATSRHSTRTAVRRLILSRPAASLTQAAHPRAEPSCTQHLPCVCLCIRRMDIASSFASAHELLELSPVDHPAPGVVDVVVLSLDVQLASPAAHAAREEAYRRGVCRLSGMRTLQTHDRSSGTTNSPGSRVKRAAQGFSQPVCADAATPRRRCEGVSRVVFAGLTLMEACHQRDELLHPHSRESATGTAWSPALRLHHALSSHTLQMKHQPSLPSGPPARS